MVRRENVRSVFSPGVKPEISAQQTPGTVTGVGSWGISARVRCARERLKGLGRCRRRSPRKRMFPG